jgi:hypothetical protein
MVNSFRRFRMSLQMAAFSKFLILRISMASLSVFIESHFSYFHAKITGFSTSSKTNGRNAVLRYVE